MRGPCVQLQLHHGSQFSLVYAARVLDRVYTDWETYSSTSAVVAGGVTDRSSFLKGVDAGLNKIEGRDPLRHRRSRASPL